MEFRTLQISQDFGTDFIGIYAGITGDRRAGFVNIELQCAGLIILFILVVLSKSKRSLDLSNHKFFVKTLWACIGCVGCDVLSIVAIVNAVHNGFSPLATRIICKCYLILLVVQGCSGYIYISSDAYFHGKVKFYHKIARIILRIGTAVIVFLPIQYYNKDRVVYSYGAATIATYVLAVLYIVVSFITLLRSKESISIRRRNAMVIWQSVWVLAAIIQFLIPKLLLVGFAAAVGMMILYTEIENPNEYIDRETGCFTRAAMNAFIKDKYAFNESFSVVAIRIGYLIDEPDFEMQKRAYIRSAFFMLNMGNDPVFRLDDDKFCTIYSNKDKANEDMWKMKKAADAVSDIPAEGHFVEIEDGLVFDTYEEMLEFINIHLDDEERVVFADEANVEALRRRHYLKELINSALQNNRVEVYYQPFYNNQTGRFDAAEALVRIRDENDQIVPPGDFIPVAEDTGQIIPLGMAIFEEVCRFLSTGKPQENGIRFIEVNVSAMQFDHENPSQFMIDIMAKYKIAPEWINLEITETASNEARSILMYNVNKLYRYGVSFSLDDFGTGRSNFDYFIGLPVHTVKFDYNFTQSYFKDEKVKYIMNGIVTIMHDMGMVIVSEGVETKEQANHLKTLGIEYIQGFFYSKPLNQVDFIRFLKEGGQS